MREKVERSDKVTVLNNTKTLEIVGDKMVSGLRVEKDKEQKILKVRGVFIEIGYMPNSDFAAEVLKLNERGEIVVDDRNRTNVLGIFAAGDVTDVPQKQIIIAAGEGAKAALSAYEYLAKSKQ
ncbi:MAG: FAD-dependent oxidoreductase [Candidatus Hodarchaeaceae archaeon]|nr:FAD-dependent oxidoreductase [Candidatus Hodarchaeaceae archaeon]